MDNNKNISLIYPADYPKLADRRAYGEERQRLRLADELAVDIGVLALAACTGIAGREYKEHVPTQPTAVQSRKLGRASLSNIVSLEDRPSFLTSIQADQYDAVDEQAILGYANRQAA